MEEWWRERERETHTGAYCQIWNPGWSYVKKSSQVFGTTEIRNKTFSVEGQLLWTTEFNTVVLRNIIPLSHIVSYWSSNVHLFFCELRGRLFLASSSLKMKIFLVNFLHFTSEILLNVRIMNDSLYGISDVMCIGNKMGQWNLQICSSSGIDAKMAAPVWFRKISNLRYTRYIIAAVFV